MSEIALRIKARDWLYILGVGVVFAVTLAAFGYALLGRGWLQGAGLGVLMGFFITLFSLFFITFMNRTFLPKVDRRYWGVTAAFFSFLSGFLGTLVSLVGAEALSLELILAFRMHTFAVSGAVGILTYIVGLLLYRFVKMRNEKEAADLRLARSRLRSLETQLNPHFLFNALNSVAELIHQDPEKAESAVLKLSGFLRHTMEEETLIPLEDELRNARNYLELENIRFGDTIRLEAPATLPRWRIPKFSIQLLAENAVKHGYGGVAMTITLACDEPRRMLSVRNDGKAMTTTARGIGLSNLDERLALTCGGRLVTAGTTPPEFHLFLEQCCEDPDR